MFLIGINICIELSRETKGKLCVVILIIIAIIIIPLLVIIDYR